MTDGLLIVDKPSGWTSHQVVGRLRRLLHTRKVGHAGTLDPMATGVLVIGVGKGTRLLGHLALHTKTYVATIRLGASTVTDDAEGDVLALADASGLSREQIEAAMEPLRGEILQRPSSVSAIKVDGKRSYARVREGEQVELKARPVTVSRFEITAMSVPGPVEGSFCDVDVIVDCSSGTYIRALARDLGEALGVGGHLTMLRRTRVGGFTVDEALTPDELTDDACEPTVTPLGEAAKASFPWVVAPDELRPRILVGQTVPVVVPADPTAMLDSAGELLGLYKPAADAPGAFAKPIAILA